MSCPKTGLTCLFVFKEKSNDNVPVVDNFSASPDLFVSSTSLFAPASSTLRILRMS
jgi:hypothetical protein